MMNGGGPIINHGKYNAATNVFINEDGTTANPDFVENVTGLNVVPYTQLSSQQAVEDLMARKPKPE